MAGGQVVVGKGDLASFEEVQAMRTNINRELRILDVCQ